MSDTRVLPEGFGFGVATRGFPFEGGQNETDDHADGSAGTQRRIIEGRRAGDRSVRSP